MGESGMSGRRNRTIALRLVSYVLAVFCALACAAMPAYASTSSEMSDDGQDYGWLYRQADVLYSIADDSAQLWRRNDAWYLTEKHRDVANVAAFCSLYEDGTLFIHSGAEIGGAPVCLEVVIRSGSARPRVMSSGNFLGKSTNPYPRLPFLKSVDDETGLRYQPSDVTRVVIAADAVGHWSAPSGADTDMDRLFEGCSNLEEAEGLQFLPSSTATSLALMFAGCRKVEELDLSGFDTAACEDLSGMFDGCESLTTLCLGPGWTQETALARTGDKALATFPVPMRRLENDAAFRRGDVIPDGPGTYEVDWRIADRLSLDQATIALGENEDVRAVTGREVFTARYTGGELRPSVTVTMDGVSLEDDDFVVGFRNNREVTGAHDLATVVVEGKGDYCGTATTSFAIEDVSAYAFLYGDGTLCLKAGHGLPSAKQVSTSEGPEASWRWYDYDDDAAGSQVPWASVAGKVRRVVVDPSFASVSPTTMAGWFAGCAALERVEGLANVDASRAGSLAGLFRGCAKLGELDLSGLKTSCVADFSGLASGCSSLERLVLGDLDLTNAKTTAGPLGGCGALNEVVCGEGFRNAELASARLALPKEAYRTSPGYARAAAGSAVPDGAGTYRLRNLALQLCTVEMDRDTYACTGKPIKPRMTVRLGGVALREGADYAVAYEDNVYPGNVTPKATVRGRGVFSGGLVVPFRIVSRVTKVGDRLVIRNRTGTFVVKVTKVSRNGRAAQVAVVSVDAAPGVKSMSLPSECTVGNVKVSVTTVSSKLTGRFRNVTSVVIGAKVTTIGAKAFSRAAKVRTLVVKSARLRTVKNCLSGSRVTKVKTKVSLSSAKRRTYKKWFTSRSTVGKSVTYSYG